MILNLGKDLGRISRISEIRVCTLKISRYNSLILSPFLSLPRHGPWNILYILYFINQRRGHRVKKRKAILYVLANVYNMFIALVLLNFESVWVWTVIPAFGSFSSVWSSVGVVWMVGEWLYRKGMEKIAILISSCMKTEISYYFVFCFLFFLGIPLAAPSSSPNFGLIGVLFSFRLHTHTISQVWQLVWLQPQWNLLSVQHCEQLFRGLHVCCSAGWTVFRPHPGSFWAHGGDIGKDRSPFRNQRPQSAWSRVNIHVCVPIESITLTTWPYTLFK